MLVGCTCGKVWQVREDATVSALRCTACGGALQAGHFKPGAPGAEGADTRVRELEIRVQILEKGQAANRALIELKEKEADEAQGRIDALEKELEQERTRGEAAAAAPALEKEVAALREELTGAKSALQEKQNEAAAAVRKMEQMDHELTGIRSDLEQRLQQAGGAVEREAAERKNLEEAHAREVEEKAVKIADLETAASTQKAAAESLQKRIDSLEEIRRAERDSYEARLRARVEVRARVDEARHLAGDLDRSLESISLSLSGLRGRVHRVIESLHSPEPEPAPSEAAVEASPAPAPAADDAVPTLEEIEFAEAPSALEADETMLDLGRRRKEEENGSEVPVSVPAGGPEIRIEEARESAPPSPPDGPVGDQEAPKKGWLTKLFGEKK